MSAKDKFLKSLELLSEPQRLAMQQIAKATGLKPGAETSEAASQEIVEAIAQKLGLPDSALANVAKAAGVAGLEVFADPLGPLGKLGKAVKGMGMAAKVADKAGDVAKIVEKASDAAKAVDKAGDVKKVASEAEKAQAMANILRNRQEREAAKAAAAAAKQAPEATILQKGESAQATLDALAKAKPQTVAESLQQQDRFAQAVKSQVDPSKFNPSLDKNVHNLTSGADYKAKTAAISNRTKPAQTLDYGASEMQMVKPQGPTLNFEDLTKEMIEKNKKK